jgi:FkbM family methyltransferase
MDSKRMTLRKVLRNAARPVWNSRLGRLLNRIPQAERGYKLTISRLSDFTVAYRSQTTDENVLRNSFENDRFFAAVPNYIPRDTDVIMDVGAHIGTFALLASRKVPQGKVYAIEPCRETFHYLTVNVALNKCTNVSAFDLALTDRTGLAQLSYSQGHWGNSIMLDRSLGGETVATQSLSEFFEANQIDECAFAKFNCEGAEFPALLSTPESTLRRIRWMLILYHCDLARSYRSDDLVQHLVRCGFKTDIRTKTAQRGWLVAERQGEQSVLASR